MFGVLTEDQVGINPATGRHMIHPEVLEGMRIYMLSDPHTDWVVKESRVRKSIESLRNDPKGNAMITLEPIPIISADLDKGKGIVFNYDQTQKDNMESIVLDGQDKLLANAIHSGKGNRSGQRDEEKYNEVDAIVRGDRGSFFNSIPTDYRIGIHDACSSVTAKKRRKPRKRPHLSNRKPRGLVDETMTITDEKKKGFIRGNSKKRKAVDEAGVEYNEAQIHKQIAVSKDEGVKQSAINSKNEMVPNEGLSSI